MIVKKMFSVKLKDSISVVQGIDRNKYNWNATVYYDDAWVGEERDWVLRFRGDGIKKETSITDRNVVSCIAEGMVLVMYWYDGVEGSKSPWIHGTGTGIYMSQQFAIRNAIEAQCVLETTVDEVSPDIKIPINRIYMTGQSRGGTTIMGWSAYCRTDLLKKYSEMVRGIICNVPSMNSSDGYGWKHPFVTMQQTQYALNNRKHPMVIVMNDGDEKTNSGYRRRMQLSISNRLSNRNKVYFYNFTNEGHETNYDFNYSILRQWRSNQPLSWDGNLLISEDEIGEMDN